MFKKLENLNKNNLKKLLKQTQIFFFIQFIACNLVFFFFLISNHEKRNDEISQHTNCSYSFFTFPCHYEKKALDPIHGFEFPALDEFVRFKKF